MPATSVTTSSYPPLNVQVHTPRLSLLGATDELLERLVPVVRKGVVTVAPLVSGRRTERRTGLPSAVTSPRPGTATIRLSDPTPRR